MNKKRVEEITAKHAAERLHMNRRSVLKNIERGELTARLVTEAPRPYWLIAIDTKFLAIEQKRQIQAQA